MNDDAQELYKAMEWLVSLYYRTNREGVVDISSEWIDMMIECVCTASIFNTYRMLDQYKKDIWRIS